MADQFAIKTSHVSKRYQIGKQKEDNFKNLLTNLITITSKNDNSEEFWALKDVSFEIKKGEVVGIIGRNGAGKSTLLKILSQITRPTTGKIEINGRIASLLEVGTGFHPELTGRENIFLNGTILGMTRKEVKEKFDEIVDFSGIRKFIDTPVKHYSSGMYVRLAFAVAAHLEPEILIIDEVLAVGDAEFQKKCLGKMQEVADHGRTVIFVSHQMGVISQLCQRAIILNQGEIVLDSDAQSAVNQYIKLNTEIQSEISRENIDSDIFIKDFSIGSSEEKGISDFKHNDSIVINFSCKSRQAINGALIAFYVRDLLGRKIFTSERPIDSFENLENIVSTIPPNILTPGRYVISLSIHVPNIKIYDLLEDAFMITVHDNGSAFSNYEGTDYGCVFVECEWK